jgi:ABC-type microcin C transport system permease subunit YejE
MNAEAELHESYSQRIWRHFRADRLARNGLRVVVFLFIIAALAPLLANSHAIVRLANGHLTFPVFESMQPIEWRFLLFVPLGAAVYYGRDWFARRFARNLVTLIWLIALIEFAIYLIHPLNDPTDDRDRAATYRLMPPIPYSPIESTPDQFSPPSLKHLCGTDSTGRVIIEAGPISPCAGSSRSWTVSLRCF